MILFNNYYMNLLSYFFETTKKIVYYYGWYHNQSNENDFDIYNPPNHDNLDIIKVIDLSEYCISSYDQLNMETTVVNAIAALYEFNEVILNKEYIVQPSRLFMHYNSPNTSSITECLKNVQKIGVCSEDIWNYEFDNYEKEPSNICYIEAKNIKPKNVKKLEQNYYDLKSCLL